MKTAILVDLENVKTIDFNKVPSDAFVFIFTGENQNKIEFTMVSQAQKLGERVSWIKIKGNGKNAADFHIAFILGKYSVESPQAKYFIISRDKGFDPLIKYLLDNKIDCKRIESESELAIKTNPNNKKTDPNQKFRVCLERMDVLRRPKTRKAILGYIKSTDRSITNENMAGKIYDYLRASGLIREVNNKIEYLDKKQ
jgi:hypothetical protein